MKEVAACPECAAKHSAQTAPAPTPTPPPSAPAAP
jgi:hypothetical protein